MYTILIVLYPHYKYYIDPDGTAYLTISERYANGNFYKAVNGLWSPLGCWGTAIFIKAGFNVIDASWIVNILAATGFLFIAHLFFLHFEVKPKLQWLLNITLAIFLCSSIFWQSFDDLWSCFFELICLRMMIERDFCHKPGLWVGCGIMAAMAYFSKAYFLPFSVLNIFCCTYFIARRDPALWIKICATVLTTTCIIIAPWIWALHYKYNIWAASTSGSMNMSWYLVGHPYWKNNITALLPPAYNDSPSYWEDPWFANGRMAHLWDSFPLFGLQLLRIGYNVYKFFYCLVQLSVFFPVVVLLALYEVMSKKIKTTHPDDKFIVTLSFLLLPSGLFLNHFESRFLWYMLPLGSLITVLSLQAKTNWKGKLIPVFAISILVFPIWCMKKMYDEGKDEYKIAGLLKNAGIHGAFTGNPAPGLESQRIQRVMYFSGNQFFATVNPDLADTCILKDIRRYHINYYVSYTEHKFLDEMGKPLEQVKIAGLGNLKVYIVHPLNFQ